MGGIGRRGVLGGLGVLTAGATRAYAAPGKPRVRVVTDHGGFVLELEAQRAPLTVANFLHYVDAQKFDGASFFRRTLTPGAPADGTLVAAPPPKSHPFPPIAHESTTQTGLRHLDGTISLGRFQPGTATDNVFICLGAQPAFDADPHAKGDNLGYAAFGRVVEGMAAVRRIHGLPANGRSPFVSQQGEWLTHPVVIASMRRVG